MALLKVLIENDFSINVNEQAVSSGVPKTRKARKNSLKKKINSRRSVSWERPQECTNMTLKKAMTYQYESDIENRQEDQLPSNAKKLKLTLIKQL